MVEEFCNQNLFPSMNQKVLYFLENSWHQVGHEHVSNPVGMKFKCGGGGLANKRAPEEFSDVRAPETTSFLGRGVSYVSS